MHEWWEAISTFEKIFWYIAVPFSVILLIQMILTFAGLGGGSSDIEGVSDGSGLDATTDADSGVFDHDDSSVIGDAAPQFAIFTIRNFIAFFTLFGWTGIAAVKADLNYAWVIILATVVGVLAMLVISSLFYFISKLADSGGNLNIKNALGQIGTVYIPINANSENIGKIQVTVQGSLREMQAITKGNSDLPTGTAVKVVSIASEHVLVVDKMS